MLAQGEPTVGELLGTLATTTASLVRQEVHLASTEMAQKTASASKAVGMIGVGGAVVHLGTLGLTIALITGLSAIVPVWLSALIVGALLAATGAIILAKGLGALKRLDLVPRQTLQTLKDDAAWAKEQVR